MSELCEGSRSPLSKSGVTLSCTHEDVKWKTKISRKLNTAGRDGLAAAQGPGVGLGTGVARNVVLRLGRLWLADSNGWFSIRAMPMLRQLRDYRHPAVTDLAQDSHS